MSEHEERPMRSRVAKIGSFAGVSAAAAVVLAAAGAAPAPAQDTRDAPPTLWTLERDTTFGRGGLVDRIGRKSTGTRFERVTGVAIDHAGRIVVCGHRFLHYTQEHGYVSIGGVARFLSDGNPDATFGVGGVAMLPAWGAPTAIALESDDRIVLLGRFRAPDTPDDSSVSAAGWRVARLTVDGAMETTFSGDGFLETSPGPAAETLRQFALDPSSGSILAAGERGPALGLMHVTEDGTFDPDYGTSGVAAVLGGNVYRIVFAGSGRALVASDAGISRVTSDGSQDAGFGTDGLALSAAGTPVRGPFDVDPSGNIVALDFGVGSQPGVYRFLADGTPDTTFGEAGRSPLSWGVPGSVSVNEGGAFGVTRTSHPVYVYATSVIFYAKDLRRFLGRGILVQTFDSLAPRQVASYLHRFPASIEDAGVESLALSPDGRTAVVGGWTRREYDDPAADPLLLRIDLETQDHRRLPDFRVSFTKAPAVVLDAYDSWSFVGAMRIENAGGGNLLGMRIGFYLSDDDQLDPGDQYIWYRQVRFAPGRTRVVQPFRLSSGSVDLSPVAVSGRRLIAVINPDGRYAEANMVDNVAVSDRFP